MELLQRRRRRRKELEVLFDVGKVFPVAEAKANDFELDLEAARFRARQGQGGTRR